MVTMERGLTQQTVSYTHLDVYKRQVQERSNPNLRIVGSVLTMFDNTTTARDIHTLLKESEDFAALHPFDASISRLKEAGEAPGLHVSCVSREKSKIGQQYQAIANEYLARKES